MSKRRKLFTRLGIAVVPAVAALSLAAPAFALDNDNGPAPGRGCPVVNTDANGNETVTYVETGTRVGLFVCGSDGEWHFGWLVSPLTVSPTPTTSVPVATASATLVRTR